MGELERQERAEASVRRRRESAERVEELRSLRQRLSRRDSVTADDVELARLRLEESRTRAQDAVARAWAAHVDAQRAHRNAAMTAEEAGNLAVAAWHRRGAQKDLEGPSERQGEIVPRARWD